MRYIILLLSLCFQLSVSAQQDMLLGYQQFPTTIMGHAADPYGNMYYTGIFKGQLTINGQVVANGNGLEDVFWAKVSPSGQLIHAYTYGSDNSDITMVDGLQAGTNNNTYFILKGSSPMQVGNVTFTPYVYNNVNAATSSVVCTDSSGAVKWLRRTNLNIIKICNQNNVLHIIGNVSDITGKIFVENTEVLDTATAYGFIDIMMDTTGKVLGRKLVQLTNGTPVTMQVQSVNGYQNGNLLYMLSFQTSTTGHTIIVNGVPVYTLVGQQQYRALLKVDTSYNYARINVLNPNGQNIASGGLTIPVTISPSDSVYAVITPDVVFPAPIDGYNISGYCNNLVVFDSSLKAKSVRILSYSRPAVYAASSFKKRIFYRQINIIKNQLYLIGQYVGINESPMNVVANHDTTLMLIGNSTGTIDLNGPSRYFLAKTDLGINTTAASLYGDGRNYETGNNYVSFLHNNTKDLLGFIQSVDNVWNPFVADTSLNLLSGAMRPNADRPDIPVSVSFFSSGSKIVAGLASGKTALDSTAQVACNSVRRDLFVAGIGGNGTPKWFSRIQTTFQAPQVHKLIVRNDKAWLLALFLGSSNDSNFIKVNNQAYDVKTNATLLMSVDSNGVTTAINLPNALYCYGIINDFSFFSNGDLAILVSPNFQLSIPGFPSTYGFYILRVRASDGSMISARKITGIGSYLGNNCMEIDAGDNIYISGTSNMPLTQTTFSLHDGTSYIDSIQLTNSNFTVQLSLLKLTWNKFNWIKRVYGTANPSSRGYNELFLLNGHPVLNGTVNNAQPFYYEGRLLGSMPNNQTTRNFLLSVDTAGQFQRVKTFPDLYVYTIRQGSKGQFFVSGYNTSSLQVDTISISNSGSVDAVALVLDSTFKAKRSFRMGSSYSEVMYDMDLYKDSVFSLIYTAQTTPTLYNNRMMALTSDMEPDAFISNRTISANVITALPNITVVNAGLTVQPNPVSGQSLQLAIESDKAATTDISIYSPAGQTVAKGTINVQPGKNSYSVNLPPLPSGIFYLELNNKWWRKTTSFIYIH